MKNNYSRIKWKKKKKLEKLSLSLIVCVADDKRIITFLESINYDCEVIIVLNGATEEFEDEIRTFSKKKRINSKIIVIPEKNLSKARNIGAINATYDKLVYYDSDCIIVDDALKLYDDILNDHLLVDGKVKFKSDTLQSKTISVVRNMGLKGFALCPSIGINKKVLPKIEGYYFDEDIKWIEDADLNRRAKKSNIDMVKIDSLTCIHDNLTFKQDLKSAYRYGMGAKLAMLKGVHEKRPVANWNLILPSFKENILSGFYCIIWNIIYCIGYYTTFKKWRVLNENYRIKWLEGTRA